MEWGSDYPETVVDFVQFNVLHLKGYGELIDLHLMMGSRNEKPDKLSYVISQIVEMRVALCTSSLCDLHTSDMSSEISR